MMNRKAKLLYLHNELLKIYGRQNWWPADTPWEVCVGAVLTQNTNWKNVEKAISNLKKSELLDEGQGSSKGGNTQENSHYYPEKILKTPLPELAELIRPSGYYNSKAKKLHALAEWWLKNTENCELRRFLTLNHARTSLLDVYGVGPETADSILLYAFNLPVFVIDTYTKRVSAEYLGTSLDIKYDELQNIYTDALPENTELFNEFHALIVSLSKEKAWKTILAAISNDYSVDK